ncbi:MAG: DUF2461 domain-containing protein [Deltaproteobacteria bacterium]|nr:DUF2461 domain-containing protein [Deltaproteobacteria bacterium]
MPPQAEFTGFTPQTVKFFEDLVFNNDKEWFEEHRKVYEEHVLAPSRALVVALGRRLEPLAPGIIADPRLNKSLFRLFRDVRFSKDKSPYKTHLGLWLWEGDHQPRMERPGFYFHFQPSQLLLGAGMYQFPRHLLDPFRQAVVDPKLGPALTQAVAAVEKAGLEMAGRHYKRVPRGFDPGHPRAELLKYHGLTALRWEPIPPEFYTPELVEYAVRAFEKMLPLHHWLMRFTAWADQL